MLLTATGHIAPPQAAARRLAEVSPRLTMALVPSLGGPYWAIKEKWPDRDPRRERIVRQEIPPTADYDIIRTFPASIRADEVVAWIEQQYGTRTVADPVKEAQRTAEATEKRLANNQAAKVDRFVNNATDRGAALSRHDRRLLAGVDSAHPMVAGFGEKPVGKRGRKKPVPASAPPSSE